MIADALGGVEDASLKAALAQKIFGRAGTALIPMLGNVEALREEAKALGLSVDPAEAKSAADLTDAMNRVKRAFGAAAFQIGSALAPAMTAFAENVKLVVVTVGKWIKQNKNVVVLVAKVAGGLLAAGAAFLIIGAIASGVAAALGAVMSVIGLIGTVLGFVLSPLGLILAAIAGGVTAWLRWTQSGQRAANFMRQVFGQIATIARTTFGGIWDAIAGGDLALAGQIAMAGLKAALLTAMAEISTALGGQWGDTIGMITSQILSGDLTGAWNTVVVQLSAVWARFVEGIVAVFTTAARALTDLWQKTTTAISNAILKSASEGGWGQMFLAGTGVNLEEEAAKSKEMDRQSAEIARRNIARMQEDLAKAKEAGGSFIDEDGVTRSVDIIERQLADFQQQLARATGENTFVADTQNAAADMLAEQADAVRDALTDLDQQFQEASQEATQRAKESVAGGATVAQDAAAEARAELERLREQAAGLRGEAQRDAQAAADAMGFDMEDVKQTTGVAGTFSAVAASRGLGAGDAADRTADAVEAIDRRMAQLVREAQHGGIQFA